MVSSYGWFVQLLVQLQVYVFLHAEKLITANSIDKISVVLIIYKDGSVKTNLGSS